MRRAMFVFTALSVVACGGSGATSKPVETTKGDEPTSFQKRRLMGHYSTEDGKEGVILDRTKDPYRAKLDGDADYLALTERGSVSGMKEYVSADKRIWFRISTESGNVELFQGPKEHEGVRVVRDADVEGMAVKDPGGHEGHKPDKTDGSQPTEFQKRRLLGHYSTRDGKSGVILDRTKEPYRARLDGDKETVTLTERGSVSGMKEYVNADKKIWFRIHAESGEVQLFEGPKEHEGVRVVRDADAEPL